MKTKLMSNLVIIIFTSAMLFSCASIPRNASVVKPFSLDRYVGKWYEIARFDFRFEKNLSNVTAEYTLNNNGTVKVVNRGYDYVTNEWKLATGKAKFRGIKDEGALKVSFFGPFYAAYNVIALDSGYRYALVAGKNLEYLWILSREKTIPDSVKEDFLGKAKEIGFDINNLVWTKQDNN